MKNNKKGATYCDNGVVPNLISGKGPLFSEKIFLTRPNLPSKEDLLPMIGKMLEKRWVTNFGDFQNELEERIKKALGVKHVLLCCNGTIGLFILLKALGLKGRVITTPFTFPATIHSICMAGMEPVFCDINPDTYTILPAAVERGIAGDVSAIMSVNVFGNMSDVDALAAIGAKHGIPVVYDSAHAFLCSYKGKFAGGFGAAEMFSFHATKLFTTLEGGAITTNDTELFKRLKLMINFGIKDEEHVVAVGLNGKMTEMNAIFGLLSLDRVDGIIEKLRRLAGVYRNRLATLHGIKFQKIMEGCVTNDQYMPIEIDPELFGLDRDALYGALKADNVYARKYFFPAGHNYDCFKGMKFADGAKLPNTDRVARRILCLPLYYSLADGDVNRICDLIESIHYRRNEISSRLKKR